MSAIDIIKIYLPEVPINKAWVFGSFARNEERDDSDIDLLVDVDYSKFITGLEFFDIWEELEERTKRKVDLVTPAALSKYIVPQVEAEKILIYEKGETE